MDEFLTEMAEILEANQLIKKAAYAEVIKITDEAYRSRMQQAPTLIKGSCPPPSDCDAEPQRLVYTPIRRDEIAQGQESQVLVESTGFNIGEYTSEK